MIQISLEQCATVLLLIQDEQERIMIKLSESKSYEITNKLMDQRKKLQMLQADLIYKSNNVEIEIE